MDILTQKRFLIWMVSLLIVLNLCLIGFFLWNSYLQHDRRNRPPEPPKRDVSSILKNALNLTPDQVLKIKELRASYAEKENELVSVIRGERDSMNIAMFNKSTNEEQVKLLARKIAENEYRMEMMRFEQAQKLKTICTNEQLAKFDTMVLHIRDYFRPDKKN